MNNVCYVKLSPTQAEFLYNCISLDWTDEQMQALRFSATWESPCYVPGHLLDSLHISVQAELAFRKGE